MSTLFFIFSFSPSFEKLNSTLEWNLLFPISLFFHVEFTLSEFQCILLLYKHGSFPSSFFIDWRNSL